MYYYLECKPIPACAVLQIHEPYYMNRYCCTAAAVLYLDSKSHRVPCAVLLLYSSGCHLWVCGREPRGGIGPGCGVQSVYSSVPKTGNKILGSQPQRLLVNTVASGVKGYTAVLPSFCFITTKNATCRQAVLCWWVCYLPSHDGGPRTKSLVLALPANQHSQAQQH